MPHKLFPSQLETEQIYLVVREHWFYLFFKLLVWAFFVSIIFIYKFYGKVYFPDLLTGQSGQILNLASQIYTLFLTLSLFLILVIYYLNIQIITNIRIVDVTQTGLFSHTISELHIDKIEDVTSQTHGIFGTLFNYGDVYVQTAGTIERFEFLNVPNPAAIEKLILDLYESNSNFAKDANAGN